MTETQNKKSGSEKKNVYYGRQMAIICLVSGTGLLVSTPFLLAITKSLLGTMSEDALAPILMTFACAIFFASLILLLGAVITGLLLPTKITYESSTGEATGDGKTE